MVCEGKEEIFMMRQKIKQMWDSVPPGLKRAVGFVASVVGFAAAISSDDESDEQSESDQSVYGTVGLFNHNTGKFDDGMQIGGIYGEPYDNHE